VETGEGWRRIGGLACLTSTQLPSLVRKQRAVDREVTQSTYPEWCDMPGRLQRATGVFWEGDDRYRVFYTTTVSEEGETDEREDDTITHTFHPHTLLAAAYVQGREGGNAAACDGQWTACCYFRKFQSLRPISTSRPIAPRGWPI